MSDDVQFVEWANEKGQKDGDVVPDPERYEVREEEGKKFYFDKIENKRIEAEIVAEQLMQAKNPVVIRYFEPKLKDEAELSAYVAGRRKKITEFLEAGSPEFVMKEEQGSSENFLNTLYLMGKDKRVKCAFVTLDLRGFTKIGQSVPGGDLTRLATVLSREVGMLADQFNGYVLRYMGDGGVMYFTGPNLLFMVNNSIFYAHALKRVITEAINPAFEEQGLPRLKFGIAVEAGVAHVTRIGSWHTKLQHELIGPPINIAFRLQSLSQENDVLIGENAARYAAKEWKARFEEVALPGNWGPEEKKTPAQIEADFKRKNDIVGKLRGALGAQEEKKEEGSVAYRLKG